MEITIRKATRDDAKLIAQAIAMGIGYEESKDCFGYDVLKALADAAAEEDTQYSYRNALVAMADDQPVGAIVGYDGGLLQPLREASLRVIHKYKPDLTINDDETEAGEFYLDSIAVMPGYRGHGIGRKMIDAMMRQAARSGHKRFGLLVDFENPDAERLYAKIGFRHVGQRPFFGHMMKHMQMEANFASLY